MTMTESLCARPANIRVIHRRPKPSLSSPAKPRCNHLTWSFHISVLSLKFVECREPSSYRRKDADADGETDSTFEFGGRRARKLEGLARRPKTAQALAQRARIVLECASGKPNTVVVRRLGLTHQTVGKWRQRFLDRRLEGLLDEPRPGAPRQVSDAQIERGAVHPISVQSATLGQFCIGGNTARWPSVAG